MAARIKGRMNLLKKRAKAIGKAALMDFGEASKPDEALTPQQVREFSDIFQALDFDNDGLMEISEFCFLVRVGLQGVGAHHAPHTESPQHTSSSTTAGTAFAAAANQPSPTSHSCLKLRTTGWDGVQMNDAQELVMEATHGKRQVSEGPIHRWPSALPLTPLSTKRTPNRHNAHG